MNPPQDRPRYRPSGRLEPAPMLLLSVVAAGGALLAGYVVHVSSDLTFPGLLVGGFLAGIPVAGLVALAVRVGRCRNPLVGGMLGLFAGLLVVLVAFQFDLAAAKGDDHFHRIDLLPGWIDDHMNDSNRWGPRLKVRGQVVQRPASVGERAFRWGMFAFGCVLAASLPAVAGWLTGAVPFSEAHGRWMKPWTTRLTRESGQAVADSLYWRRTETLRDAIKQLPFGAKIDDYDGLAQLVVEHLPGEADAPVYLSVGVMIPKGAKQTIVPNWLISRWELTPAEAAVVADVLRVPEAAFGTPKPGTRPGDRASTLIAARVLPLPDQDAGLILSRGNLWVATAIGLAPLLLGLGLGAAAGVVAGVCHAELEPVELGALIAGAVASVVASLVWLVLYGDWLPSKYFHARARRVIADRPDPLVNPDDPDVIFVQMVPRKNWGYLMLENAEDVGFLLLDAARGVLLFEGDRERWIIPRESVVSFELEGFDVGPPDPNAGPAFWLVVLRANVGGSVWEAPIAPRPVTFRKQTNTTRREGAEDLHARIAAALGLQDGLPASLSGQAEGGEEAMTEAEWLRLKAVPPWSVRTERLVAFSRREATLFGAGCVRATPGTVRQRRLLKAVEEAEKAADTGEWAEVARLHRAARAACGKVKYMSAAHLWALATARLTSDTVASYWSDVPDWLGRAAKAAVEKTRGLRLVYVAILRDVAGNPFRPMAFDPAWRTDTAVSLAKGMYAGRDFSAMPILADALQDAGCESEEVLRHCRDEKLTHVRGCWVIDLVLGKA